MIKENLMDIEKRIHAACNRSGRNRSEVTLIAVSKTKPTSMIEEAYSQGIRHFGENKVQELVQKYEDLQTHLHEYKWHLIGHLQRNKVKYIVDKAFLIHSVDSLRLAEQIEEEAAKKGLVCDILIEVNIAEEETKFGIKTEELLPLLIELVKLKHIRVRGLMTIAPFVENPEKNRVHFRNLKQLYVDIKTKKADNMFKGNTSQSVIHVLEKSEFSFDSFDILSMGMTGDFEVAIEEGATMVRVGTGIFGDRNYS